MTSLAVPGLGTFADIGAYMRGVGAAARAAARELARADTRSKNAALAAVAACLRRDAAKLLAANAEDIGAAIAAGHDAAFVDRLTLGAGGVDSMASDSRQIAAPDPSAKSPI
jgi:glutamate-5-semialdehyde dehydrogenase